MDDHHMGHGLSQIAIYPSKFVNDNITFTYDNCYNYKTIFIY